MESKNHVGYSKHSDGFSKCYGLPLKIFWPRGQQTFPVKVQIVNILNIIVQMMSVATIELSPYGMKVIGNMEANEHDSVSINFI